jgi:hypothetical protein
MQVALDEINFRIYWAQLTGGRPAPKVDFTREIVLFINALAGGGSCPAPRLTSIELDGPRRLLYGVYTRPASSCGDIGATYSFVVTVARAALPTGELDVRVAKEFLMCEDCGRSEEQVRITL